MYKSDDIKIVGNSYQTKDGKYQTKTSSPSFYYDDKGYKKEVHKGYAYWYNTEGRLGSTAYDYLFFIGKEGINNAVKVLNKVIL